MSQNAPQPLNAETSSGTTTCQNCHSSMPTGLRFCRNCGYRLGEGLAEYTETVRFQNVPNGAAAGNAATTAMPGGYPPGFGMGGGQMAATAAGSLKRRKKRMSGMTWIFLVMIMFFVVGAGVSFFVPRFQGRINMGGIAAPAPPRSAFGVDNFEDADGGATFDSVAYPGSPADKAGLVGGDIITTFDGQRVTEEDELRDLLEKTPIGKTVDVVYIRDGETKTTKLTTISSGELEQLGSVFAKRPEGRGKLGIENQKTVEIPGTKLHGVLLRTVSQSLPGDMAGLKSGDIVIDFAGTPIRTAEELNSRIQFAIPYETIVIKVMRGSEILEIPVKMGRR
jgi:S1-C subfamily serine protease